MIKKFIFLFKLAKILVSKKIDDQLFFFIIKEYLLLSNKKDANFYNCVNFIDILLSNQYENEEFVRHETKWGKLTYKVINGVGYRQTFQNVNNIEDHKKEQVDLNRGIRISDMKNDATRKNLFRLLNKNLKNWF